MGESAVPGRAPGMWQRRNRGAAWRQSCTGGDRHAAAAVAGPDARQALDRAYQAHYQSLVRLAALLTGDAQLADEVTQESFVAWYSSAARLPQADAGLQRLVRLVVVRSRREVQRSALHAERGEQLATAFAGLPLVQALTALPSAQREAVVLTLYLDLSEQQAAAAVGVGLATLRRNLSLGMQALGEMPFALG